MRGNFEVGRLKRGSIGVYTYSTIDNCSIIQSVYQPAGSYIYISNTHTHTHRDRRVIHTEFAVYRVTLE